MKKHIIFSVYCLLISFALQWSFADAKSIQTKLEEAVNNLNHLREGLVNLRTKKIGEAADYNYGSEDYNDNDIDDMDDQKESSDSYDDNDYTGEYGDTYDYDNANLLADDVESTNNLPAYDDLDDYYEDSKVNDYDGLNKDQEIDNGKDYDDSYIGGELRDGVYDNDDDDDVYDDDDGYDDSDIDDEGMNGGKDRSVTLTGDDYDDPNEKIIYSDEYENIANM